MLFVGAVGLAFLPRDARRPRRFKCMTAALTVAFVVQVVMNGCMDDWWSGDSFGQRRLTSSVVVLTLGLAWALQRAIALAPRIWEIAGENLAALARLQGLYLVCIHVLLWSYTEPHNIVWWMAYEAPRILIEHPERLRGLHLPARAAGAE